MNPAPHRPARPHVTLAVAAAGQLMVVLDGTIINVALPSAQRDLGFADSERAWLITSYALAMGSLLLLGGRLTDQLGKRTVFVAGLIGFGLASGVGGLAADTTTLILARAAQGLFAALLAPAALAIVSTSFTLPKERSRAFAVFGAVSGSGAALGLVLGGVLAETIGWRWCLLVNVPLAAVCAVAAFLTLRTDPKQLAPAGFDLVSVFLIAAGMSGVIAGLHRIEVAGSADAAGTSGTVLGAVFMASFAVRQRVASPPLLPLHIVAHRLRGTAYATVGLAAFAMVGSTLFLTYELQGRLGMGPLAAGFAFLPLTAGIMTGALAVGGPLLPRVGTRFLVVLGSTAACAGMMLLLWTPAPLGYFLGVMPGISIAGLGLGTLFAVATPTATGGVRPSEGGIASASLSSFQQIGAATGVAAASTLAAGLDNGRMAYALGAGAFILILVLGFLLPGSAGKATDGPPAQ